MPKDDSIPRDEPKAEKILAAAKILFMEHGFAATSMDQVANQARVSKTTLYARFPSKEALFAACIATECRRRGMHFAPESFDGLELEEALRQIGRRFVDLKWSREAIRVQQIVYGEAARFPDLARIFYEAGPEHGISAVTGFFARAAARGLIRIEDPEFVGGQFLAALEGGVHCAVMLCLKEPLPDAERDGFVARVVRLFLDGVPRS